MLVHWMQRRRPQWSTVWPTTQGFECSVIDGITLIRQTKASAACTI